jgi:hypothetical protein
MRLTWVAILLLISSSAWADPGRFRFNKAIPDPYRHPPPGVEDPYRGLKNGKNMGCCHGKDCMNWFAEDFLDLGDGRWFLKSLGLVVESYKVLPSFNSDFHICKAGNLIRCVLIPMGS